MSRARAGDLCLAERRFAQRRREGLLVRLRDRQFSLAESGLRRVAVGGFTTIGAYNLEVLVGHLVQKSGERYATVFAKTIDRLVAHHWVTHNLSSSLLC